MIIGLDADFWVCLCWVSFCSLISASSLDFQKCFGCGCLFYWPAWLVCSQGILGGVGSYGEEEVGVNDLLQC